MVTNRFAALPIFAVIMFLVYYISVSTVGTFATDWANDGVFGDGWHLFGIGTSAYEDAMTDYAAQNVWTEDMISIVNEAALGEDASGVPDPSEYGVWVPGVPVLVQKGLDAANSPEWLNSLIVDGIVGGVGAVLGFVPQMLVLFILLAFLESCGYMARIAFVLDRILINHLQSKFSF